MNKVFVRSLSVLFLLGLFLSASHLIPASQSPKSSRPPAAQAAPPQLSSTPSSPRPKPNTPTSRPNQASAPALSTDQPFTKPGSGHVNYPYQALLTPNDSLYASQWHLPKIHAPSAWDVSTGTSGPIIAVIDTGFALSHPDLQNRWWTNAAEIGPATQEGPTPNCTSRSLPLDKSCNNLDNDGDGYRSDWRGWDFSHSDNDPQTGTVSPNSATTFHGTFVAGAAAATGNNASGVAGVSWGSRIMPLEALDDNGSGYTDTIASAVQYAVAHGASVINLSLGSAYDDPYLHAVIDHALASGVTVVAAAGNTNCNCMLYPANYPEVIAVGASDQNDGRASFSSYGPNLDIVAPGVTICSALWTATNPNGYGCNGSGTSFAAPLVSGTVALMLSITPGLSPSDVARYLAQGADKVAGMQGAAFNDQYGYGQLNSYQAVATSELPTPNGQLLNKQVVTLSSPSVTSGPLMNSTCIGPAGSTCTVTLSNDLGSTIVVGSGTLSPDGGLNLEWNASSLGITPGTWKVEAILSQNGQSAHSNIQMLQVN